MEVMIGTLIGVLASITAVGLWLITFHKRFFISMYKTTKYNAYGVYCDWGEAFTCHFWFLFKGLFTGKPTEETNKLIDEAIAAFDVLITKVNAKDVENKKAHFKQINIELEQTANQLIAKINDL